MLTGYYQKNKERLQKDARERYQNFSEKNKNKKDQYARKRYRNLSIYRTIFNRLVRKSSSF